MAKTPQSQGKGPRFHQWSGNWIPHAATKEGFPGDPGVKNPPTNIGETRDMDSVPGSRRSPGEGSGNPLQYSCLKSPVDRAAWWATVHKVAMSPTRFSD